MQTGERPGPGGGAIGMLGPSGAGAWAPGGRPSPTRRTTGRALGPVPALAPARTGRRSLFGARHRAPVEVALILGGLAVYLLVRAFTHAQRGPALAHARSVLRLEDGLHLAQEQRVQGWFLAHAHAASFVDGFYVWAFWPMVAGALVLLHRRSARGFVELRNALLLSGLVGLVVFALFPVAPPRMLLGFHDTVDLSASRFVAHPSGLTNQYAAIPSFHVGWTALACVAVAAHLRRRWARALVLVPAGLMAITVVATANHFLVDGLIGSALTLGTWTVLHRRHARPTATARPLPVAAAPSPRPLAAAS